MTSIAEIVRIAKTNPTQAYFDTILYMHCHVDDIRRALQKDCTDDAARKNALNISMQTDVWLRDLEVAMKSIA